jgi:hypothetical protein
LNSNIDLLVGIFLFKIEFFFKKETKHFALEMIRENTQHILKKKPHESIEESSFLNNRLLNSVDDSIFFFFNVKEKEEKFVFRDRWLFSREFLAQFQFECTAFSG